MNLNRRIRVLLAKVGSDGHDRGVKVVVRACRDAGYEVVYTGLHQAPEQIVSTAIQEDVDLIGLSCLSGANMHLFSEALKLFREKGVDNITGIGGGIITGEDVPKLKEAGSKEVFLPGTPLSAIY